MEWGLSEAIERDGFDVVSSFWSPLTSMYWSWEDKLGIAICFPGHQFQPAA